MPENWSQPDAPHATRHSPAMNASWDRPVRRRDVFVPRRSETGFPEAVRPKSGWELGVRQTRTLPRLPMPTRPMAATAAAVIAASERQG